MKTTDRILVAEQTTLLGAALVRQLRHQGYTHVLGAEADPPDYRNREQVDGYFRRHRPDYVFVAAGRSGGILANQSQPASLMLDNLLVQTHLIDAAHRHEAKRLLYLASSCSYPRESPQPLRPDYLLTGSLEPTNEAYAVAKIAGIKLCEAYRSQYGAEFFCGIPSNPFGPGDDFSPEDSHVIPALIRKLHEAADQRKPVVEMWGTGRPRRDFIYADDAADAAIAVLSSGAASAPINLGCGSDISIADLAEMISEVVGFQGKLQFNPDLPDGMPVKTLDWQPLKAMGWRPRWSLRDAIGKTYEDYRARCLVPMEMNS